MAEDTTPPEPKDISLKDAFDLYQKQSDSQHKLWGYFQIVSIAVLGFVLGNDNANWMFLTYVIITVSYAFFAVCSHYVIALSQAELNQFADAVKEVAKTQGPIAIKLVVKSVSVDKVRFFHAVASLIVIGAILVSCSQKYTVEVKPVANPQSEKSADK